MNIQRKNSAHHFRMQSEREQTLVDFTILPFLSTLLVLSLSSPLSLPSSSGQLPAADVGFQELFNVSRLEGVYPTMSILYQQNQHHKTAY